MKDDIGEVLLKLSKNVANKVCSRWWGFLTNCRDEVESESLLSATKANLAYPGQVTLAGWSPLVERYAYGVLITALRTQDYLPKKPGGKVFYKMLTNLDIPEILQEDMGLGLVDDLDELDWIEKNSENSFLICKIDEARSIINSRRLDRRESV